MEAFLTLEKLYREGKVKTADIRQSLAGFHGHLRQGDTNWLRSKALGKISLVRERKICTNKSAFFGDFSTRNMNGLIVIIAENPICQVEKVKEKSVWKCKAFWRTELMQPGYDGLLKMLDVLLSQDMEAVEKKRVLGEEFGIPMTRKLEGGLDEMCNLSKGVYDSGYDKARADDIKKMMHNKGWEIDECMDVLEIPADKREMYRQAVLADTVTA